MHNISWNIVGHSHILKYLENCIVKNTYHHAYIFLGPENIGKTTLAKIFSKIILCEKKYEDIPCEKCDSCLSFNKKLHPDFHEIHRLQDEKTKTLNQNITIEQIIQWQYSLHKHSLFKNHTVALISEADTLSEKAKHALLKTLEEPNPQTVIILIVHSIDSIPKTIISRCQTIKFYPIDYNIIVSHLIDRGCARSDANLLTKISYGMPGVSIAFAESKEDLDDYISHGKAMIDFMRLPLIKKIKKLSSSLNFKDNNFTENIENLRNILDIWILVVRDLFLIKNESAYLINNVYLENELMEFSKSVTMEFCQNTYNRLLEAKKMLYQNVHPKIILENFIINL